MDPAYGDITHQLRTLVRVGVRYLILGLVDAPVDTTEALTNLAYVLLFLGRPDEAYAQVSKSAAILRELGLRDWLAALTSKTRGDAALWLGRYAQARSFTEAGPAVVREIGRHNILAICLRGHGMVEIVEGNYARATQLLREGVAAARRVRSYNAGTCAVLAGLAALRQDQPGPLRRYLYEGLQTALEQGTYLPLLYGLPLAAAFLLEEGQVERAVELYALALEQPFVSSSCWYEGVVGRHIAAAAATLPPEVVAAAQERGRARDMWATVRELVAEWAPEDG